MVKAFFPLTVAGLLACSSSQQKGTRQSCDPGENVCYGNYLGTCQSDGASWALGFCGQDRTCEHGACKENVCVPGSARCQDDWTLLACKGLAEEVQPCGPDNQCYESACLPMECEPGEMRCIFDTRYTCAGTFWVAVKCPDRHGCKDNSCVPWACVPREGICVDHPANPGQKLGLVCALNGTEWAIQNPCKADEICQNGYCFPKPPPKPPVSDIGPPEVVDTPMPEPDFMDIEPLGEDLFAVPDAGEEDHVVPEPPNRAVINGKKVVFSEFVRASILAEGVTLIALHSPPMSGVPFPDVVEKQQIIEIRILAITPGQTGTFRCEDNNVLLWYRFGKYLQGGECKDFDYQATTCVVTIEGYSPDASLVFGTFDQAHLVDCLQTGPDVTITDGHFYYQK